MRQCTDGAMAVAFVALVVLYWVFRRTASPSLSLAALRQGGMSLLLIIVILVLFANLWFYMTVGVQSLFGLNALQTAVAMLPAQASGIVGAAITRDLLRQHRITPRARSCSWRPPPACCSVRPSLRTRRCGSP